jgi:hypothetical protein
MREPKQGNPHGAGFLRVNCLFRGEFQSYWMRDIELAVLVIFITELLVLFHRDRNKFLEALHHDFPKKEPQ